MFGGTWHAKDSDEDDRFSALNLEFPLGFAFFYMS